MNSQSKTTFNSKCLHNDAKYLCENVYTFHNGFLLKESKQKHPLLFVNEFYMCDCRPYRLHRQFRKRLNNRPIFFHACISYMNIVHACKNGRSFFKRLRYIDCIDLLGYILSTTKCLFSKITIDKIKRTKMFSTFK